MADSRNGFEAQALLDEARRLTGCDDFGDDRFREPFQRLLFSLEHEARLNTPGRATQRARVLGNLTTRLSGEAFIGRHPEILDERIEAPVVILGPSRSGTTRLHRLLAEDPGHHAVLWWENRCPVPQPGTNWRVDDPRIAEAREEVRLVLETVPELAAIHPWEAEGPDEDALLMEHAFVSHVPESTLHVPGYRRWLEAQDWTPGYEYLERMLKILQWQKRQRGDAPGRWILKTPQHLRYLEPIRRIFPDVRVIQTHRDPLTTVPSMASLFSSLWALCSDDVDRLEVGRQVCERLDLGLRDCLAFREHAPGCFHDVWFDDMQMDPIGELERIYGWLGDELGPKARRRADAWLVDNARDKRPPHDYSMDRFGYTADRLAAQFAVYRERFILSRCG